MRVQRTPTPQDVRAPAGLRDYAAIHAACPDGTAPTDDLVIGACHRLN
jgi:hypothetical protein